MDPISDGLLLVLILFLLLGAGIWVGVALLLVGGLGLLMSGIPVGDVIVTQMWGSVTAWSLTPLPLFIWMGEILYRTDLASNLFRGLAPIFRRFPGRLMHVNIGAAALFASVCGSSTAMTAVLGRMSVSELGGLGYDKGRTLGTVAAAGGLGILLPPSIVMIVYGAAAEVSIIQLFIAGIIPGLMLAVMLSGYIVFDAFRNPHYYPASAWPADTSWRDFLGIVPIMLMIIGMIASIYTGFATATEAAAVGVVLALVIAAANRQLTFAAFIDSIRGSIRAHSMIVLILAGSSVLSTAMGFSGLPNHLAELVRSMNLSPGELLTILTVGFLVLGLFLDGLSIVLLTATIVLPMVKTAGIDPVWFGVYLVVMIEIGLLTPPVGFNLFVLSGTTNTPVGTVAKNVIPFLLVLLIFTLLISVFPDIVLHLPRQMSG